jgi:hypothetical protein
MSLLGSFAAGSVNGFGTSKLYIPTGQILFTTSGFWTIPSGITNISVLCIGAGAGYRINTAIKPCGGGGLSYINNLPVINGSTIIIYVGVGGGTYSNFADGQSSRITYNSIDYARAEGGRTTGQGGVGTHGTGGEGNLQGSSLWASGGGAGGYSGTGGIGSPSGGQSYPGTGGGGGGGLAGSGGGTDVFGEGVSGQAFTGIGFGRQGSTGGSGNGTTISTLYGGGGGGETTTGTNAKTNGFGGSGAVRIIWGAGRSFPSTNTMDQIDT